MKLGQLGFLYIKIGEKHVIFPETIMSKFNQKNISAVPYFIDDKKLNN